MAGAIRHADDAPPGVVIPALVAAALSAAALGLWVLSDPPPANPHYDSQDAYLALGLALSAFLAGLLSATWSHVLLTLARHRHVPLAGLRRHVLLVQGAPIALGLAFGGALFMPPHYGAHQDILLLIAVGMTPQAVLFVNALRLILRQADRRTAGAA